MSIQLITGFTVNNSTPLDNRIVASGAAARNSIPYKYTGMRVFDTSNNRAYYYNGVTFSNEITDQVNGSSGYVPVFTSQNYIGNSGIFQVNSGTERRIGISTNNPLGSYTYMQIGGTSVGEDPSWFSGQSLPLIIHKGGSTVIGYNWYYTSTDAYFNPAKGSSIITFGNGSTNGGDLAIANRVGGTGAPIQTIYFSNTSMVGIGSNWNPATLPVETLDVTGNIRIKHLRGSTSTPTGAAVSNPFSFFTSFAGAAGNSPSAVTFTTATDLAGIITITTGASGLLSSSISPLIYRVILNVTFNTAYGTAPIVVLTPANLASASLNGGSQVYTTATVNGFSIIAGTTALTLSTQYKWHYHIIQ